MDGFLQPCADPYGFIVGLDRLRDPVEDFLDGAKADLEVQH